MLLIASVLVAAWLLGLLGVYHIGWSVHLFLVAALGVLLLAFLKARDDARGNARRSMAKVLLTIVVNPVRIL
jgi:hypothetical protein